MGFRSSVLAMVGGAIVVVGLGAMVAISLPESGTFETEPVARSATHLEVKQDLCKSASYIFDDLYSEKFNACSSDSQCEIAVHPIGCKIAIAGTHRETFNSQVNLVRTAMKQSDSNCGLPMARCRSGGNTAVCERGKCVVLYENSKNIDPHITPRMGGGS